MSELGGDAQIPYLWRMSVLLELCCKDVKEQMLMTLDEVGDNHEHLKAKVVSHTAYKAEQARGGQKEMTVPIGLDHVSGGEPDEGRFQGGLSGKIERLEVPKTVLVSAWCQQCR